MSADYTLYFLKCPTTLEVFYIGITRLSTKKRLREHLKPSKKNINVSKYRALRRIVLRGENPIIEPIFVNLEKSEAEDLEKDAILAFRAAGFFLTNIAEGGYVHISTKEQREQSRKRMLGNKMRLGIKHTKEALEKISRVSKGKVISESQKALTRETVLKRYGVSSCLLMPEAREKARKTQTEKLGKPVYQYDTQMNFVKKHLCIADASKYLLGNENGRKHIRNAIKTKKLYRGFYWFAAPVVGLIVAE